MTGTIKLFIDIDNKTNLFNVDNNNLLSVGNIFKLIQRDKNEYFFTVSYNGEKILTDKLLDTIKNEDNIELRIKLNKKNERWFRRPYVCDSYFPYDFYRNCFCKIRRCS